MKDRVPTYPGRVRLVPVAGQSNTYDMTRADEPTEAGMPLNKANLLTDATAALCGLGADATINDMFAALYAFAAGRCEVISGYYIGTGTVGADNPCSLSFARAPKFIIMLNYLGNYNLVGKFAMFPDLLSDSIYKSQLGFAESFGNNWGKKSADGKTIYWYVEGTTGANYQMNASGHKYYYAAFCY